MITLENTLPSLSRERPIFHSEADFQHALAWHIHPRHPDTRVRLEQFASRDIKGPTRAERDGSDGCGTAIR
jgi:hypothetical protein